MGLPLHAPQMPPTPPGILPRILSRDSPAGSNPTPSLSLQLVFLNTATQR